MEKDNKKFKFEPIYDLNIAKNYNGFIGPDGAFYRVSLKHEHTPTHQEWAYGYIMNKTDYVKNLSKLNNISFLSTISRLKDKQEILIDFYGYIYYSHDEYNKKPIIIYPNPVINNKSSTNEQKQTLSKILELNNEINFFPDNINEYSEEQTHTNYVDDFILRRILQEEKK